MGSVGVIVSSILIENFGWNIADPICSIFIAALILLSVLPLLKETSCILLQRSPMHGDKLIKDCLERVSDFIPVSVLWNCILDNIYLLNSNNSMKTQTCAFSLIYFVLNKFVNVYFFKFVASNCISNLSTATSFPTCINNTSYFSILNSYIKWHSFVFIAHHFKSSMSIWWLTLNL